MDEKSDRDLGIYTASECPVCESYYYDELKLKDATNYTMHSNTREQIEPDGIVLIFHVCPRLKKEQLFVRREPANNKHRHGVHGKDGTTTMHPISRKHRKSHPEEALSDEK